MSDFDLETFLPYLLNQAGEASSLAFQKIYKDRYGLLRTDWRVLFHLGLYGELTASGIGIRARIHKTKVSRAVQRLEDRRYLERNRDEADRRIEHLRLTVAGKRTYTELRAIAQDYEADLIKGMTKDQVETLRLLLRKLAER